MGETTLKLTKRQWASVVVVWLVLLYFGLRSLTPVGLAVAGVILLAAVYLVQLVIVVGGPRVRARFGASRSR